MTPDGRQRMLTDLIVPRPLLPSDYFKGFLELLQQLTTVGDISNQEFRHRFDEIFSPVSSPYLIAVIEDVQRQQIVASGTLFIEKKFVHRCGSVGHIEDVVVDASWRGNHLGERIVRFLTNYAKDAQCYKVILDCSEDNVGFYQKCGFSKKEAHMLKYFD